MKLTAKWFDGKYPSFNLDIASSEGREPFLTIKDCKIIEGPKGAFVGWPSRKDDNGKWWRHVYASEGFQVAVIEEARKTQPSGKPAAKPAARPVDDDEIPF